MRNLIDTLENRRLLSASLTEAEPNNGPAGANPLARVPGEHLLVSGRVSPGGDRDWFKLDLRAGDVLGAVAKGTSGLNPALRVVGADGNLLIANDDAGGIEGIIPAESPLQTGNLADRDAAVYYVMSAPGTYYVEVSASADASSGKYTLDAVVARPAMEREAAGAKQILFLDFDGARFQKLKSSGTSNFSPLSSFMSAYGLTADDEGAVITRVVEKLTDILSTNIAARGLNPDFGIDIRNSRDHADPFGVDPLASRVVIGGTNAEAGLSDDVIGYALTIDVGNFKTDDEAVTTLEWILGALANTGSAEGITRVEFVAYAIAVVTAHEAGHIFGCFHTHQPQDDIFAGTPSLMDPSISTVPGRDGVFGNEDDYDLQFVADGYAAEEPFVGYNDTLNTVAFGLTTGKGAAAGAAAAASPAAPAFSSTGIAATRHSAWSRLAGSSPDEKLADLI